MGSNPTGPAINASELFWPKNYLSEFCGPKKYFGFEDRFFEPHRIVVTGPLGKVLPKKQLNVNPEYQRLLPALPKAEYQALKNSIENRELYQPIDVNEGGTILEGHHRATACRELQIDPVVNVRNFDDPLREKLFVIEANLVRRQLNDFQKIELSQPLLEIETELAGKRERNGKALSSNELRGQARDIVAKRIGISPTTYQRGLTVIKEARENVKQKLRKGSESIGGAYLIVTRDRERESIRPVDQGPAWVRIYNQFFQKGILQEDSVDLVLTDPPYTDLEAWDDLGKVCAKVLKPRGCLVAYSGKYLVRHVMNRITKYFDAEPWLIAIPFEGPNRFTYPHRGHIMDKWQLVLFYHRGRKPPPYVLPDLLQPAGREKQLHDYQKSLPEASRLVELFTLEGMTVLDPFAGAGTIVEACVKLKRNCIAFEKNPETFRTLQQRFVWAAATEE